MTRLTDNAGMAEGLETSIESLIGSSNLMSHLYQCMMVC